MTPQPGEALRWKTAPFPGSFAVRCLSVYSFDIFLAEAPVIIVVK